MFQGSMVAVTTPMREGVAHDTALDPDALRRLVEFHIENGTDAIVAVGTTGESATLNEQEHCEVIRQVVEQVTRLIKVNEYKRRQAPVGIRVSHRSFGKDWRYPITSRFRT